MIKLLNIKTNYCNNIKNTTTPKTISFRGIKALKNDTFEPGKNFTVRQCYNFDEFEGFLDFYPSKDPSNILCARYFICDSSNPPSYLKGDKINCQFDISEIDEAKKVDKNELKNRIDALEEFNPMLGHRGCRIAVSYPEIYQMQTKALCEAAFKLQAEKVNVHPEIMVPIIMNSTELKLIVYGKKIEGQNYKGLVDIIEETRQAMKAKPIDFKIGTMIELPAAALGAGDIARYAQFFSFGTNDLTQTTLGLSRDDFNSFMPDYTLFDLIDGNPFAILDPRVKELIEIAVRRGTASRPDLVKGLCGEHGARPENVKFCMEAGLNYISCSSYSVPIALLSIAQLEIEKSGKN